VKKCTGKKIESWLTFDEDMDNDVVGGFLDIFISPQGQPQTQLKL